MLMIGCDFHTRFQQIAMMDSQTGEIIECRLDHEAGEAWKFYGVLPGPARIGMEATGNAHWFERMLAEWRQPFHVHGGIDEQDRETQKYRR